MLEDPHHQGPQMRRPLRRHLPLHDAAVRHAPHAHGPGAPGLGGDPFHRFVPVPPFPLRVDVGARAPRVAGAADIVTDDGVAAAGEPGGPMPAVVITAFGYAGFNPGQPAVGVILDDRGKLPGARRDARPRPPARRRRSSACARGGRASPRNRVRIPACSVRSCRHPLTHANLCRAPLTVHVPPCRGGNAFLRDLGKSRDLISCL